jgi:hypothetical protein
LSKAGLPGSPEARANARQAGIFGNDLATQHKAAGKSGGLDHKPSHARTSIPASTANRISDPDEVEAARQGQNPPRPAPRSLDRAVAHGAFRQLRRFGERKFGPGALAGGVSALLLSACRVEPQDSTPFNAVSVPPPRAPAVDTKTSAEHRRMIALFDGEYRYPAAETYLNEILVKLANADERASEPWR